MHKSTCSMGLTCTSGSWCTRDPKPRDPAVWTHPIYPKVLDEATSALDVNTERMLYSMLVEKGVAVVSPLATTSSTCEFQVQEKEAKSFCPNLLGFPSYGFPTPHCDV